MADDTSNSPPLDLERRELLRLAGAAALLLPACSSGPLPYPPDWHGGGSSGGGNGVGGSTGGAGGSSGGSGSSEGSTGQSAGGSSGSAASSGGSTGSGSSGGTTAETSTSNGSSASSASSGSSGGTTSAGGSSGGGSSGGASSGGSTGAGASSGGSTGGSKCLNDANTLVVSLAANPGLAQVGGSVALTDSRYSDPVCQQDGLIVIQASQGQFVALSNSCTHACCQVSLNGGQLFCPCHGSTFDLQGNVTGGPAGSPLQSLPVCTDGTNVYVEL